MNDEGYRYTEQDVEATLHFLSTNFPAVATPENAVKVLIYLHSHATSLQEASLSEIENLLQDIEEQ